MMRPTPYGTLAGIWSRSVDGDLAALGEVVDVLSSEGIRIRQDDGTLRQINQSVPYVKLGIFVVGLRYVKNDGSQTEDHFVFDSARPTEIDKYYGRRLETVLAEYHDTHKQQVDFNELRRPGASVTDIRTITFNIAFPGEPQPQKPSDQSS